MAKKIVTHAADQPPPADAPSLLETVSASNNDLYDVVALLSAVVERIDDVGGVFSEDEHMGEMAHETMRLARIAKEKTVAVTDALFHAIDREEARHV